MSWQPGQQPTGNYSGQQGPYAGSAFPGAGDPYFPGSAPPPGFVAPPPGYVAPPPAAPTYTSVPLGAPQPAMYGASSSYGEEPLTGDARGFQFDDQTIRKGFIRKVYGILMCQLLLTSGVIALFSYHQPTKEYVRSHIAIFWVAFAVTFATLIAMACCGNLRRKSPINFIFLAIFTAAESVLLGVAASTYDTDAVLMAAGLTCAVCFALTVFAFQTKWDFTVLGAGLFVAVIILMIFGIVAIFIPGKTITMIYCSIGVILFSLYLIYDTQMMMGGKHKYSISPEEYIFAALNLYLDIVNIFLYLLTIIGLARD